MLKNWILITLLMPTLAWSEITPTRDGSDPRVRFVEYNARDVVKLTTFYGVSTHVRFEDGENIKDIAVGDDKAWVVAPRGNHLFIKPKASKADTNVTVVTDRRVYQLALTVSSRPLGDGSAWRDPNLVFSLSYRYPEAEAAKAAEKAKTAVLNQRLNDMKTMLSDAKKRGVNLDYWVAGSQEISPTSARDDGRFSYLTFSNNRDMPAIYATDADGNEALVNTSAEGNTIIVHRVLARITLRKGNLVACVVNKGFSLDGGTDNLSGTISPNVERTIKGTEL